MSCGDIYHSKDGYVLQLGEIADGLMAPFVAIQFDAKAQSVIGCDPGKPYYFIRKNTCGNFPPQDAFIIMRDASLLTLDELKGLPVARTLTAVHMEKIQACAKFHKQMAGIFLQYLTL